MSLDIISKTVKYMEESLDPFDMSAVSMTRVSSTEKNFGRYFLTFPCIR